MSLRFLKYVMGTLGVEDTEFVLYLGNVTEHHKAGRKAPYILFKHFLKVAKQAYLRPIARPQMIQEWQSRSYLIEERAIWCWAACFTLSHMYPIELWRDHEKVGPCVTCAMGCYGQCDECSGPLCIMCDEAENIGEGWHCCGLCLNTA